MILGGDELSHTQNGNNNAYCQDNELTWLNWDLDERKQQFLDFVRRCSRIWREQPVLQRRKFFLGRRHPRTEIKDISFFESRWQGDERRGVECRLRPLPGRAAGGRCDQRSGRARRADRWGHAAAAAQRALGRDPVHAARDAAGACLGDAARHADAQMPLRVCRGGEQYPLFGRSLALLRTTRPAEAGSVRVDQRRSKRLRKEAAAGESASRRRTPPLREVEP